MTTDNALDPPPVRQGSGRPPHQRIAAMAVGLAVAVVVLVVIFNMVFRHPTLQGQPTAASFGRGGAAARQAQAPPPAVSPAAVAQGRANLSALQRAANSPALAARPVQVASVSPPAGPPPSGVGVNPSKSAIGPAAG